VKTPPLKRLDLPQLLDSGSFDHAVILTYTFDPIFFEEYCLPNLEGLQNCRTISVILDRSTYGKIVTAAQTERPKQANLRYLLHPVSVPGVFHPKLILLTSKTKGRLLFGSANFTRPGITGNAELVGLFDFKEREQETFAPLMRSAFTFLQEVATRSQAKALVANLKDMYLDSPWLESREKTQSDPVLLTNMERPLMTQLAAKVGEPIKTLSIVSRYFDPGTNVLEQLVKRTAAQKVKIFTQNRYTNLPPSWLKHSLVKSGQVEVFLTNYSSDERDQPLHGKAFFFETVKDCLFAYGSANCTTAALLSTANEANVESLIAITLSSRDAKALVERLLDPLKKAERLLKPDQLLSVLITPDQESAASSPIKIIEAEAENEKILLWLEQPLEQSQLRIELEFSAGRHVRLPLNDMGNTRVEVNISPEISKRLSEGSAIISIQDVSGNSLSNRVLITNLLDFETGASHKKARFVKEAEQNAAGLLSVLLDLRSGTDEDALRTFLTFCDIPLSLGPRPGFRLFGKESGSSREGMRSLGHHNFTIALSLHDLALNFCERHFRKLKRHVSNRHPDGIPNFLHISLAVGGVLESQIDRALSGLEAREHVTPDEWATFRAICDPYFSQYRELTSTVWNSYLAKMIHEYSLKRIRDAFEPELQPLADLADRMVLFRDRVENLRLTKCLGAGGLRDKPYSYFQSVFSEQKWPKYSREMRDTFSSIVATLKGDQIPLSGQAR